MSEGDAIFEAKAGSMQTHAVNGAVATGLAQVVKLPFQVASILVLARLLDPVDYGIYAMVDPLVSIALLLLNFGIFQAVIQFPALHRAQVSALFWAMLGTGVVGTGLFFACSPLISAFYHDPRAGALAAASSLFVLNSGLTNIPLALMNRQMKFGWLAVINAIGIAVGLVAGIVSASLGAHYWALAIDYAATSVVTLAGVWLGVGWLPREQPDFRSIIGMYKFGFGLMLSDAANIIARHTDSVLIGHYAGPAQTGLYDRGNKLALIPMERINQLLERLLLPILSRLNESGERYRRAYMRIIRQLMLLFAPGTVAVGVTAPVLIPFLLGAKWADAAPIFAWLALAALHQPVSMTMNFMFVSQGRVRAYLVWNIFSAVTTWASFIAGVRWGAVGVAAAFALSDVLIRLPFLWWWVSRAGPVKQSDLYGAAAPFAAGSAVAFTVLTLLQHIPFPSHLLLLAASAIVAYAVFLGVLTLFKGGRMAMADTVHLARTELPRFVPKLGRARGT
jgi:polysaccharide transporter, PST family